MLVTAWSRVPETRPRAARHCPLGSWVVGSSKESPRKGGSGCHNLRKHVGLWAMAIHPLLPETVYFTNQLSHSE